MQSFSTFFLAMRECVISADASDNEDFKNLRSLVYQDASEYFLKVAPTAKEAFGLLNYVFKFINDIEDLEEFKEMLPDCIKDV